MTINDKIHAQISEELDIKRKQVNEAISIMFDFLIDHMENGDLTPIRMQYMGLWQCKPLRVAKLKERGLL